MITSSQVFARGKVRNVHSVHSSFQEFLDRQSSRRSRYSAYVIPAAPMHLLLISCQIGQSNRARWYNGRDSFQLFVGVFDKCLVWYLLELPSEAHAFANMTSLRAIDGDTSYHSRESFSLHQAAHVMSFNYVMETLKSTYA